MKEKAGFKRNLVLRYLLATVLLLNACATPQVTQVKKMGDSDLSCEQILKEYEGAVDLEAAARKERTVTGTNVAAAIFFFPALLGTYANTEEAINAAKDRQKRLEKIATEKGCKLL